MLSQKSLDCLRIVAGRPDWDTRIRRIEEAAKTWGEKVVYSKLERLADRGYIDYGVSVRSGWLTERGEAALAEAASTMSVHFSRDVAELILEGMVPRERFARQP